MPASYKNVIKLRLDSNIILFNESSFRNLKLLDIFSVKNGTPIILELGNWDIDTGIILQKSKNRWDRRTDLKGVTFVNCFATNPGWAEYKRDKNGIITGSFGYFQEMLFYIAKNLNLTFEIVEAPCTSVPDHTIYNTYIYSFVSQLCFELVLWYRLVLSQRETTT